MFEYSVVAMYFTVVHYSAVRKESSVVSYWQYSYSFLIGRMFKKKRLHYKFKVANEKE
jgi:hypothetical protein